MAPHVPVFVPRQQRRDDPLARVEHEVARTAELVLRLTALADRYAHHSANADRVALLRATVMEACRVLEEIATEPLAV